MASVEVILELYREQLTAGGLVLARVGSVVLIAPAFGARCIPMNVRVLLAIALAFLITPLQWHHATALPSTLAELLPHFLAEALTGGVLGVGIVALFNGFALAGRLVVQSSGLALRDAVGGAPGDATDQPQLFQWIAMLVFVAIGGHRMIVGALLETFAIVPLGAAQLPNDMLATVTLLLAESFRIAVSIAAPVLAALLVSNVALALVNRAIPQLDVWSVGFGLNYFVLLGAMSLALGGIAHACAGSSESFLQTFLVRLH